MKRLMMYKYKPFLSAHRTTPHAITGLILALALLTSCGTETTPTYTVTTAVTPEGTGTITHAPTGTSHDKGTELSFTASASDGYLFSGWQGDLSGSSNPASLTLTKDVQITALFEKKTYPLSVVVEDGGTVTEEVIQAKTDYDHGTVVRLTALPYTGWDFVSWSGDAEGTESTLDVTVTSEMTITATFEKQPMPLVLTIEGSGSVKATPEKDAYLPGDSLQLIANPDYGYRFLNWTYDGYYFPNDTVNIVVGTSLDIGVEFEYGEWVPLGEEWDYPNNTTHSYLLNRNHPNYHLTASNADERLYDIYNYDQWNGNTDCDIPANCYGRDYRIAPGPTTYYYDFTNDGLLDMISYLWAFSAPEANDVYASINGKYLFVDDYFGSGEKSYGDIELRWGQIGPLGDFTGDGVPDLQIGGFEGHKLSDGTHGEWAPGRYITVNQDKTLSYRTFSSKEYHHDAATGDIDNDGDTDIMFIGHLNPPDFEAPNGLIDKPLLFKNDGNGGFVQVDLDDFFRGYKQNYYYDGPHPMDTDSLKSYNILTSKLFDLDGDGWLDLIVGYDHNRPDYDFSIGHPTSRVYWNQGDGVFDVDEFSELPNSYPEDQYSSIGDVLVLGINFIDFDEDGDYDIVGCLTPNYNGYIIQIHENLGDKKFRDVTESIVDDYDDISQQPESEFVEPSNFYNPIILDIDDDGDLDILPHYTGGINDDMTIQIYWENRGGKFYRSY